MLEAENLSITLHLKDVTVTSVNMSFQVPLEKKILADQDFGDKRQKIPAHHVSEPWQATLNEVPFILIQISGPVRLGCRCNRNVRCP